MNQLALSFPAFYPLSRLDSYLNHNAKRYHVKIYLAFIQNSFL